MLSTLSHMSTQEADECKNHADASTQALKVYHQQLGAAQYNLNVWKMVYGLLLFLIDIFI